MVQQVNQLLNDKAWARWTALVLVASMMFFGYIMLQTVSSTFAINADTPPILAAWIPNIIFAFVAYFCYRKAPN